MKFYLSRRTKTLGGIVIGIMLILSGAIFGLAKTGVINIKGLADPLVGRVEITVDSSNTFGGISLKKNGNPISPSSSYFSGNVYIIPSLNYGNYSYQFGMPGPDGQPCMGSIQALNHISTSTKVNYPKFTCGSINPTNSSIEGQLTKAGGNLTIPGASITFSGSTTVSVTSDTSGNYTVPSIAPGNYSVTISAAGYNSTPSPSSVIILSSGIKNQNFSLTLASTPPPVVQTGNLKLTVRDKNGNLANIQYSITECDILDCSTGGLQIAYKKKTTSALTGPNATETLKIGKGYEIFVNTDTGETTINPSLKMFRSKIVFLASTNIDINLSSKKVIVSGQIYNSFPDGSKQYVSQADLKLQRGYSENILLTSHNSLDFTSNGKFANWFSNAFYLTEDTNKFSLQSTTPYKTLNFEISDSGLAESMYDATLGAYIVKDKNLELNKISQFFTVTVKDKNSTVITGSDVSLNITSCDYSQTIKTDSAGKATFTVLNCVIPADPQLVVSKTNYINSVMTFDFTSFKNLIETQHQISVTLKPADPSAPAISGRVIDIAHDNAALNNATVQLLINQDVNPSPVPKETKSDNKGLFTLSKPSWTGPSIISTFKDGYTLTTNSKIFFEYSSTSKYEFNLALSKKMDTDKFQYPVLCLDRITLKPIPGQIVDLYENSKKIDSQRTDNDGRITFSISGSANVKLLLNYKSKDYTSTFTFPVDPMKLSAGELDLLYSEGIFMLGSATSSSGTTIIKLLNKENGQPVVNATVTVTLPFSAYLGRDLYADNWVKCQSDEHGYVRLPEDLRSSKCKVSDNKEYSTKVILDNLAGFLSNPGKVFVGSERIGYKDFNGQITMTPSTTTYTAEMVSTLTDEVCVDIQDLQQIPSTIDKSYIENNLSISNISETAVFSKANITSVTLSGWTYNTCFSGIPSGNYYAMFKLPNGKIKYNDVGTAEHPITFFYGDKISEPTLLKITICEPGYENIYSYDNNIFFILTDNSMEGWYKSHEQLFKDASSNLFMAIYSSIDIGPTSIYLSPGVGEVNAEAMVNDLYDCGCGKDAYRMDLTQSIIDFYLANNQPGLITSTILHEYGHLVFQTKFLNQNNYFFKKWKEIWDGVDKMGYRNTFFELIKDSRFETVPADFGGHPEDNDHEMFASFYSIFFNHHTELLAMIKARPENGDLQNILAFMWQIFGENVGTYEYNDAEQFPVVGGEIAQSAYNFQDIRSGKWRPAIYNALPINEKIAETYKRIMGPALNLANWSKVSKQIQIFNSWLRNLFTSNPSIKPAQISGKITDQNGAPLKNAVVIFGGSYAAKTDINGAYNVPNILSGNFSIAVKYNNQSTVRNLAITSPTIPSVILIPKQNKTLNIKVKK